MKMTLLGSLMLGLCLSLVACERNPSRMGEPEREDASDSIMPGVGDGSLDSRDAEPGASETVLPGDTGMSGFPATGGTSEIVIPGDTGLGTSPGTGGTNETVIPEGGGSGGNM